MREQYFGIEFDTMAEKPIKKLRSDLPVALTHAFCDLYQTGTYNLKELNVLANEVIRDRLYPDDVNALTEIDYIIKKIVINGMSYSDIVILRSMDFSFEDILGFAQQKKSAADVIDEYGLDGDDCYIENVPGLTSLKSVEGFVTYESVLRYLNKTRKR